MEAERATSNPDGEVCAFGGGFSQAQLVTPTTPAGGQVPSSPAEYSEGSSYPRYSMSQHLGPPFPVRSMLEQGSVDSLTPSSHRTEKMIYSSPAVNIPNIVLTPALSFKSQALTALHGEQFRPNMIHSWNLPPSPATLDGDMAYIESFNDDQQSRVQDNRSIMVDHCSSYFVPNVHEGGFSPRGPFAAEMPREPDFTETSVPFLQYYQAGHFQNEDPLTGLPQREEREQIHSNAATGQGFAPSNLNNTLPTSVPHQSQQDSTRDHPHLSPGQSHDVPKLYYPNRIFNSEFGLTALEVRHHYLPFHNLPSLIPRRFGDSGPMVGLGRGCFRYPKSDSSTSPSSASSSDTITTANCTSVGTSLADLVRESDPMLPNPKANEKDAEYITPSASTYLNPTAVRTPNGAHNNLWYFPGDRDFLWTYSRAAPTEAGLEAHSDNDAGMFPPREIMATYTSNGGWRTMPRGSYAGTRFGAVGERLVPLTRQDVGEVGSAAANVDIETDGLR